MTDAQAINAMKAGITSGAIGPSDAYVGDKAIAANAMWGANGFEGKWSYSRSPGFDPNGTFSVFDLSGKHFESNINGDKYAALDPYNGLIDQIMDGAMHRLVSLAQIKIAPITSTRNFDYTPATNTYTPVSSPSSTGDQSGTAGQF